MFTSWTSIEFNSHGNVSIPSFREKTYESGASNWEKSVLLDSVSVTVCSEILMKQDRKRNIFLLKQNKQDDNYYCQVYSEAYCNYFRTVLLRDSTGCDNRLWLLALLTKQDIPNNYVV